MNIKNLVVGAAATAFAAWITLQWVPDIAPYVSVLVLYNRIQRDANFENDTRRRIFDHVRGRPGESISQIAVTVGVSHSTASYHLERLIEFNLLTSTPDGNKVRFFINGGLFTEEDRRVMTALANMETRRVLATILTHPGSYRAELTQLLGVSSPTVNWHLVRLTSAGLVVEEQRGRNRYLFADSTRVGGLLRDLESKTRGTAYDAQGIHELARLCGAA